MVYAGERQEMRDAEERMRKAESGGMQAGGLIRGDRAASRCRGTGLLRGWVGCQVMWWAFVAWCCGRVWLKSTQ